MYTIRAPCADTTGRIIVIHDQKNLLNCLLLLLFYCCEN